MKHSRFIAAVFAFGLTAGAAPGAFYNLYDAPPLTRAMSAERYAGGSPLRTKPNERPENWATADSIAPVDRKIPPDVFPAVT